MDHPSQPTLQRFAAGTASRQESQAVVAHLLKGCAACGREIKSLMHPAYASYDDALDRFDRNLVETLETSIASARIVRTAVQTLLA